MIRMLFFDFDGVLTTDFNGTGTICEYLSKEVTGSSVEAVTACYEKHCNRLLLGGRFTDVWDDFCSCMEQKISPDVLRQALRTIPVNEAMLEVVQSLSTMYRLGMITDNPEERMDLLNEDLHLTDLFDPIVVSAMVHALKHDGTTAIFDAALRAADCQPQEAVFIDNQERNLSTPAKMGMHTYWHDDKKNDIPSLLDALQKLGVKTGK
ncbi:MAG: HAD hydrolase-like protein [Candidatus Peregrinibacteria bacterium]